MSGHMRRGRGRRVLAWAAALFVSAQVVGGLLLDYVWPRVRFPSIGQVVDKWRSRPEGPDVLCLGSSRFGAGIVPAVMKAAFRDELGDAAPKQVFNASVPVGDPIAEDFVFRRLLREGARPSLVVVEVSPETVNGYNDWFAVHVTRQLRWEDVPAYLPDVCWSREAARFAAARLFPLYVHRQEIGRQIAEAWNPPPKDAEEDDAAIDWNQVILTSSQDADEASRVATTRNGTDLPRKKLRYYSTAGTTGAALEHILARCRERHIQAVLVGAPVTALHRWFYSPEIDAAYRDYMARLCRTYCCRFVDWRDQIADDGFRDIHHLRQAGGVEFSRRLTREVLAPLWRGIHSEGSSTTSQAASR